MNNEICSDSANHPIEYDFGSNLKMQICNGCGYVLPKVKFIMYFHKI